MVFEDYWLFLSRFVEADGEIQYTSFISNLKQTKKIIKEKRGMIILLYYTENITLKRTLKGACPTAQRLASSV